MGTKQYGSMGAPFENQCFSGELGWEHVGALPLLPCVLLYVPIKNVIFSYVFSRSFIFVDPCNSESFDTSSKWYPELEFRLHVPAESRGQVRCLKCRLA